MKGGKPLRLGGEDVDGGGGMNEYRPKSASLILAIVLSLFTSLIVIACLDEEQFPEGPPLAPTLDPISDPTDDPTPDFSWEAIPGSGITYDLEYATASNFDSAVQVLELTYTSYTSPPLADGMWYWRVRATNNEGVHSPWANSSFEIDTTPPTIREILPADESTNISLTTGIKVVFYESMNTQVPVTLSFAPALGSAPSGPTWSATYDQNDTANFTLPGGLDYNTDYNVTISGGADVVGYPFSGASFGFRSQYQDPVIDPIVLENTADGIKRDTSIKITYNNPMDTAVAVAPSLAFSPPFGGYGATPAWSTDIWPDDTATFSLTDSAVLKLDSETDYTVTVSGGQNIDGVPGPTGYLSFTTLDDVLPTVLSTTPADGAVDVTVNTQVIEVVFDETMDTDVSPTLTLDNGYGTIPEPTWSTTSEENDTATFALLTEQLTASIPYTGTVSVGQDDSGNLMADHTFNFTTADQPILMLIDVKPINRTLPKGDSLQMTATGTYDDGSTPADITAWTTTTWSSSKNSVATVGTTGLVTAVLDGTATIKAEDLDGVYGLTTVTVVTCSFTITPPASGLYPDSGGTGTITVIANLAVCTWTATSPDSWVTFTSEASGTGDGTVTYSVHATDSSLERITTLTIAEVDFPVTQSGGACAYTIDPASDSFPATGGPGSVSVTANYSDCSRDASSPVTWVTITSGSPGLGSGSVGYSVEPTDTSIPRSATLTITGQPHIVMQAAGECVANVTPGVTSYPAAGGTGAVTISLLIGCPWTASSSAGWIKVLPPNGSGSDTVTITVDSNPSSLARPGKITVAGETITINQDGVSCTPTPIEPPSKTFSAVGGTGSISVKPPASDCNWTATSSDPSWISITSGFSGPGNGTVYYSVQAKNDSGSRYGSITIGGNSHSITQTGCTYSLNDYSNFFGATGGSSSFNVLTTHSGCTWTASGNRSWITGIDTNPRAGNDSVSYNVSSNVVINTYRPSRDGSISVTGGNSHSVLQSGCSYSISPTSTTWSNLAGSQAVYITANSGCSWTASESASWISSLSKTSGSGSATIWVYHNSYNVNGSTSSSVYPRDTNVSVAGKTLSICQDKYISIDPPNGNFSNSGQVCGNGDAKIALRYFDNGGFKITGSSSLSFSGSPSSSYSYSPHTNNGISYSYKVNCGLFTNCWITLTISNSSANKTSFTVYYWE